MTLNKLNVHINTIQESYICALILPYLQAKRLAYYYFMDPGRRHKISGSETKDFISHD